MDIFGADNILTTLLITVEFTYYKLDNLTKRGLAIDTINSGDINDRNKLDVIFGDFEEFYRSLDIDDGMADFCESLVHGYRTQDYTRVLAWLIPASRMAYQRFIGALQEPQI